NFNSLRGSPLAASPAVTPSEVEAATQPRKLSGRGQAFNPAASPSVAQRDSSTPLRSARNDEESIRDQAASSRSRREIPRNSKSRISVSSIKLFGQDAPAVMPITADPFGNQKCETTSRFSCKL